MTRQLRPYQVDAIEAVDKGEADGHVRQAGVAATGLGKSTIAARKAVTAAEQGQQVIMLAHRTELLDQLTDAVRALAPACPVGRIAGATKQLGRPVTVAMTPTMANKAADRWWRPERSWDRVVYDEFHHAAAPSNRALLERLGCMGGVPLLGLTATLTRADKHGLGDIVDHVPFRYGPDWAITRGYLVRPRGKVVIADHLDLKSAKVTAGDYQDGELGAMVAQDVDQIVAAWCDHAQDRITASFAPDVASASALTEAFGQHRCDRHPGGIAAELLTGKTPMGARRLMYDRLAHGVTRVLSGVMVHTEGWDCPPVSCILMSRPTRREGLYQQIVGRGLRLLDLDLFPWCEAKTDCLVLDVVGASRGQKLASLVDLFPSAVVDLSELEELPCEDCGDFPCTCEREGPARDPLGGRQLLEGPQTYEDIDLLMADSNGAWLATRAGHPFLVMPGTRRAAIIFRETEDTYRVGEVDMRGRLNATRLAAGATLDEARRAAENAAIARKPYLASPHSVWRTRAKNPTFKQLADAVRYGIPSAGLTAAELSELIDITVMSERMDPLGPGAAARGA